MSSSSSSVDKATNTGTPVIPPPHKWHVNEIITMAYTKRSVDIANPNHPRGPHAKNYAPDRYVLHTMETNGIFELDSEAFIDFCTNQTVTCEYREQFINECSFMEFLIHNNLSVTFREVVRHNDPVFRFPTDYEKCGENHYHLHVLMTLLNTSVSDPDNIFCMLDAVPIQEEWKQEHWWFNWNVNLTYFTCPLILMRSCNTIDKKKVQKLKRRLHLLNSVGLLIPMWKSGFVRWYSHEAHSIPATEDEYRTEFHAQYGEWVKDIGHEARIRAPRQRDECLKLSHGIWEFMLQLDKSYPIYDTMSVHCCQDLTSYVPRKPLLEDMYMNTALVYPHTGDEVIYRGCIEAYRGKQFQVVRTTGKLCVLFDKTGVECQYVVNDLCKEMLQRHGTGDGAPESYYAPSTKHHLPGRYVKLFTAATYDLEFVSEYTPKVGDYCTMSTSPFRSSMKHVVEITRIPNNSRGEYTVPNNARPSYRNADQITVRYEGMKMMPKYKWPKGTLLQKVHMFTILPSGKPLYIDMRESYRCRLNVFPESITLSVGSQQTICINTWLQGWKFGLLQPFAQYQHTMGHGELKTHVARYMPYGVIDCRLPATEYQSTRNDVYVEFEDSSCFEMMIHPGQQVEYCSFRNAKKQTGTIKYVVKRGHGLIDVRERMYPMTHIDMLVIERNKTYWCERSIQVVSRSALVKVEAPQPRKSYELTTNWVLSMKGRAACNGLRTMRPFVMTLNNFRSLLPYLTQLFKEDTGDIERYQTIRNDVDEHDISVHDAIPFSHQIYALPVEVGTVTEGSLVSNEEYATMVDIDWEKDGDGNRRYHALHLCQYLCKNAFVHGERVSQNRVINDRRMIPMVTYVEPTNIRWRLNNETPYRHKIDVVRFLSVSEIEEHQKKYEEKRKSAGKKRVVDNNGNSSGSSAPEKRMRFDKDALKQQQIEQISKMISDNKERLQALILRRDTAINAEHCDPQHLMRICHHDPVVQQQAAADHAEMVRQLYEVNADIKHLRESITTLEEKLSEKTKK